jgi:flagellin-like hook-associated protein FlgL
LLFQASSDTYSLDDRDALDLEFVALKDEIGRIQANTKWNGFAVMDTNVSNAAQHTPFAWAIALRLLLLMTGT